METSIVRFKKQFTNEIVDICYATGFAGSDLSKKGIFEDKKLFGLLFCKYYLMYEPENCFVALDEGKVVGYIIGTDDSMKQNKMFLRKMIPRIMLRIITYTIWFKFKTFRKVIYFSKYANEEEDVKLLQCYPAHLHMNLYEEYQSRGLGTQLMKTFLNHLITKKVKGVHLGTSNYNEKAIKFYQKMGFDVYKTTKGGIWEELDNLKSIIYSQSLKW